MRYGENGRPGLNVPPLAALDFSGDVVLTECKPTLVAVLQLATPKTGKFAKVLALALKCVETLMAFCQSGINGQTAAALASASGNDRGS